MFERSVNRCVNLIDLPDFFSISIYFNLICRRSRTSWTTWATRAARRRRTTGTSRTERTAGTTRTSRSGWSTRCTWGTRCTRYTWRKGHLSKILRYRWWCILRRRYTTMIYYNLLKRKTIVLTIKFFCFIQNCQN